MDTVWNQHVWYYQDKREIEEQDVHALFLVDLCKTLAKFWDFGDHVVFGMDTNDDVREGSMFSDVDSLLSIVYMVSHRTTEWFG